MCLIDKRIVRYADHDIPIFKMAEFADGKYYSPYQSKNRLWRVNTTYFTLDERRPEWVRPESFVEYGQGYFHAFTNRYYAELRSNYNGRENIVILEGYIPEGTRYAIDSRFNEICAHKMILNI